MVSKFPLRVGVFRLSGDDLVSAALFWFIVEFQPNLDLSFICFFLVYFLVAFFGF